MAKHTLSEFNGPQLAQRIKDFLGKRKVTVLEPCNWDPEEQTSTPDKIKGVMFQQQQGCIIITLESAGRREIYVGDEFTLHEVKGRKRLKIGYGGTIIQA